MNILVVDDQPEVADAVVSGVNWANLSIDKVFSAYSVKEAQKIFENNDIDILLCDIEMPPTNGFELLRWAKNINSNVASIFLSSHAEFEYAQEAVRLGSFDYILQPAPYEEIERAVERAIGKVKESKNLLKYYNYENYRSGNDDKDKSDNEKLRNPVQRAMDYIRENIDKDISRADIAEAIYLNPEYLSRLFKRKTGGAIVDYILAERIRISKSLLSDTNIPVSLVASKVGYTNFSYFSQVFKKSTGLSPMEYRAANNKNK